MTLRVFSAIQPTHPVPHIGNYLGAIRNWVRLQNHPDKKYSCIYAIADLHALTAVIDGPANGKFPLAANSRQLASALIASGISPDRSILFVQSTVFSLSIAF
jgi:tryptophanyl-tRNA synthetase